MTAPTPSAPAQFDAAGELPQGRLALQASAGTGKTWNIAALASRFVAEGHATLDQLLIVTFTRAATAALRDRVRRRLVQTRQHLSQTLAGSPPPTDDRVLQLLQDGSTEQVTLRLERIQDALRDFDAATITTIHGFCQRVLAAAGYAGDVEGHGDLVEDLDELTTNHVHDLLVAHFHDVPAADQEDTRPKATTANAAVKMVLANPDTPVRPVSDQEGEPPSAVALSRLATEAAQHIQRHKRRRGLVTYDDLLLRLDAALRDPAASTAVAGAMRRAFAIALIDEFQDTDPTQWSILQQLFGDRRLVLIGDPKQAIYSFRGADVTAYLDAVGRPGTQRATLGTNYRSDGRLVTAVNRLFAGTQFGDDRITYDDVAAAHPQDRLIFPDGPRPPLQVRAVTKTGLRADAGRQFIAADLVDQVSRLLSSQAMISDGADPTSTSGSQPLQAGDCAVLVRTNHHARDIKNALNRAGIHAVVNGVGSVLDTPAAADWGLLLDALDRPSSSARVRALALTWLVGRTAAQLADMDQVEEAELHELVHRWSRVLAEHGVAALVRNLARDTRLHPRVLGLVGGDRWLADLEHIAELLHTASSGESMSPVSLRAWIADHTADADGVPSEQLARRLESDARAVQILTIHRAKGLQFPVVFCPYQMSVGQAPSVPLKVRDANRRTVIDLGSSEEADAKATATAEDQGEQLRLLYVALTRAQHRLVVWWWPYSYQKGAQKAALSKVLFNQGEGPDRVVADQMAPELSGRDDILEALQDLQERMDDAAQIVGLDAPPAPTAGDVGLPADSVDLDRRQFNGRVDRLWTRSSFSALTRPRPQTLVPITPDTVPVVDDEVEQADIELPTPEDLADHLPLPLQAQPAGALFGTMVHAVLEHTALDAPDLQAELAAQVAVQMPATGMVVEDPANLAEGLLQACITPLGPLFGDGTLAGISRADRLDELDFELPVTHRDTRVTLSSIASVIAAHVDDPGPFAGYPALLRQRSVWRGFRGYLVGIIDLVWRRHTPDGPVFHIIDHKSNRLYGWEEQGSTWHYRPEALQRKMQDSDYLLQALVYRVALHRYLRWRQPGYDPARHLGAVGYTFLRGMAGPGTPEVDGMRCGVLAWQPPEGLTEALSDLLEEGT